MRQFRKRAEVRDCFEQYFLDLRRSHFVGHAHGIYWFIPNCSSMDVLETSSHLAVAAASLLELKTPETKSKAKPGTFLCHLEDERATMDRTLAVRQKQLPSLSNSKRSVPIVPMPSYSISTNQSNPILSNAAAAYESVRRKRKLEKSSQQFYP